LFAPTNEALDLFLEAAQKENTVRRAERDEANAAMKAKELEAKMTGSAVTAFTESKVVRERAEKLRRIVELKDEKDEASMAPADDTGGEAGEVKGDTDVAASKTVLSTCSLQLHGCVNIMATEKFQEALQVALHNPILSMTLSDGPEPRYGFVTLDAEQSKKLALDQVAINDLVGEIVEVPTELKAGAAALWDMHTRKTQAKLVEIIKAIPFLTRTNEMVLDRLASMLYVTSFEQSQTIWQIGDQSSSVLFVRAGKVLISADQNAEPYKEIKRGGYFGEMAFLSLSDFRTNFATTFSPIHALQLDAADFHKVLKDYPDVEVLFYASAEEEIATVKADEQAAVARLTLKAAAAALEMAQRRIVEAQEEHSKMQTSYVDAGGELDTGLETQLREFLTKTFGTLPTKKIFAVVENVIPEFCREMAMKEAPPWKQELMGMVDAYVSGDQESWTRLQEDVSEGTGDGDDNVIVTVNPLGDDSDEEAHATAMRERQAQMKGDAERKPRAASKFDEAAYREIERNEAAYRAAVNEDLQARGQRMPSLASAAEGGKGKGKGKDAGPPPAEDKGNGKGEGDGKNDGKGGGGGKGDGKGKGKSKGDGKAGGKSKGKGTGTPADGNEEPEPPAGMSKMEQMKWKREQKKQRAEEMSIE
jgi:CRP-like cAMP-binding protein